MSWVKRNLYFVISCAIAVVLLGAAGWYCFTQWQGNNADYDQINQTIQQLKDLTGQAVTADPPNIETARVQTVQIRDLDGKLRKFIAPIPSIPNTNILKTTTIEDRDLTIAMHETIAEMRSTAAKYNVALDQPDFAFSFTAQLPKAVYVAASHDHLARELGEVKAICDILFSNRINSLVAIQRERSADDTGGTAPDYLDSVSVTNGGTIISPYSITFRAFDEQLGRVFASFANQPLGIIVRSVQIEPAGMTTDQTMPGTPGVPPYGMNPATPTTPAAGGVQIIQDEKRLQITMLLNLVRLNPTPGR